MILVDANILMYASGAEHPHKAPSLALLERVARGDIDGAIDAEVLQEVCHRYRAIDRWSEGCHVYDSARKVFRTVLPITAEVVDKARALLDEHDGIDARDALHASVVLIHGLEALCSYDKGLDRIGGVRRVIPDAVG